MPCSALTLPPSASTSSSTASIGAVVVGRRSDDVDVEVAVGEVAVDERRRVPGHRARRWGRPRSTNVASSAIGRVTSALCTSPRLAAASECASRQRHSRSTPRRVVGHRARQHRGAEAVEGRPSSSSQGVALATPPPPAARTASGDRRGDAEVLRRRPRAPRPAPARRPAATAASAAPAGSPPPPSTDPNAQEGHQPRRPGSARGAAARRSRCRACPRSRTAARPGRSRCCP